MIASTSAAPPPPLSTGAKVAIALAAVAVVAASAAFVFWLLHRQALSASDSHDSKAQAARRDAFVPTQANFSSDGTSSNVPLTPWAKWRALRPKQRRLPFAAAAEPPPASPPEAPGTASLQARALEHHPLPLGRHHSPSPNHHHSPPAATTTTAPRPNGPAMTPPRTPRQQRAFLPPSPGPPPTRPLPLPPPHAAQRSRPVTPTTRHTPVPLASPPAPNLPPNKPSPVRGDELIWLTREYLYEQNAGRRFDAGIPLFPTPIQDLQRPSISQHELDILAGNTKVNLLDVNNK
ncbi:hypothetical protein CDD81_309 [Ophiocordyceps australis]|uniref:Uncharacterized protein n=1 Tax=Ophiocordyceps australis TaxID=1399860 RepID=A0A2C5XG95_9HYPO|nr:hypothetical protein CDD81_309 [Ophiocordyceps australis]